MTLTVDLHHHVIPSFYWQAPNEDGNAAGGITPPHWSLDGAIAYSTRQGSTSRSRQSGEVSRTKRADSAKRPRSYSLT